MKVHAYGRMTVYRGSHDKTVLFRFPKFGRGQERLTFGWGESKRVYWGKVPKEHRPVKCRSPETLRLAT